mmetsp:Transcript_16696/g.14612  ORF Transcript_16696/g.14612 Transcript_16696/m.14612 type:complete len:81 (+) Transcript_16696:1609-1851(+)
MKIWSNKPELKTDSRRYMNSVRYKKKVKEKTIEEIKEEEDDEGSYKQVLKDQISNKDQEIYDIEEKIAIIEEFMVIKNNN